MSEFEHENLAQSDKKRWPRIASSREGRTTSQALADLQRDAGNQAIQHLLRSGHIQAKLAISNPDDPEEREADNVAHTIMRKETGAPCSCSPGEEMCEECQQKQSTPAIQRRASSPSAPAHIPRIVSDVLRSPGHPLDSAARAFFEPRFGRDFSDVRIHTGAEAAASARSIHAHAYTAGSDIVFASGQYSTDTTPGRTLLAHELAHVVAQGQDSPKERIHRDDDDEPYSSGEEAAIGSEIERIEVQDWTSALQKKGYRVYSRGQFDDVDWLARAFSDKRARPDLVAVNPAKGKVIVGDITAGPWSTAKPKPGDVSKLPHDIGGGADTKAHLEKTVDYARQAARNLPKELGHCEVVAQDRWWKEGGYSREVTVASGRSLAPTTRLTGKPTSEFEPEGNVPSKAEKPALSPEDLPKVEPPSGQPSPERPPWSMEEWSGLGRGLFSFGAQLAIGWIHDRAVRERIHEQAARLGWVPFGAPSGEGLLYDLGSWLIDPSMGANVGFCERFDIKAWRNRVKQWVAGKNPGDTIDFTWQVGAGYDPILERHKVEDVKVTYRKGEDGMWHYVSGWEDPLGKDPKPPDLNLVIDPWTDDEDLRKYLELPPCHNESDIA